MAPDVSFRSEGIIGLGARILRLLLAVTVAWLAPLSVPVAHADKGADQVTVGAFIYDIQEINLAEDSFTADLYLWFRWKGARVDPSDSIEPMNSNGTQNTSTSQTGGVTGKQLYPEPIDMPDGSKYQAFRYQGVFSKKMSLEKYPFDVQNLTIVFEDENEDSRSLIYVPDTTPVEISPAVPMPGYQIGKPSLTIVDHVYPTNFGDITAPQDQKYSRIIIAIPVDRDPLPYMVKIILPILIVVLITSLIYILPARMEDARAGIGVTAMLTIVALQWTTDSNLPSVEYLMMLDMIYIVSLLYVLVAMGYTVLASRRNRHEMAEALTRSLDRRMGIWSLVVYTMAMALTIALYLASNRVELL